MRTTVVKYMDINERKVQVYLLFKCRKLSVTNHQNVLNNKLGTKLEMEMSIIKGSIYL